MFYNSFANYVICYGLSVHGTAAKTNLKAELSQKNLNSTSMQKEMDSQADILEENKFSMAFELYIVEFMKEVLKQLGCRAATFLYFRN